MIYIRARLAATRAAGMAVMTLMTPTSFKKVKGLAWLINGPQSVEAGTLATNCVIGLKLFECNPTSQ